MPTERIPMGDGSFAILTHQDGWKKGDQPPADPSDYLGWHAWAEVQYKAGLRQRQCGRCQGWKFPQEMSAKEDMTTLYRDKACKKPFKVKSPVCNSCSSRDDIRQQ